MCYSMCVQTFKVFYFHLDAKYYYYYYVKTAKLFCSFNCMQ